MLANKHALKYWSLIGILIVSSVGCSNHSSVSGTVTANGSPLPEGRIGFAPISGGGTSLGSDIEQGAYRIEGLDPGKYKVIVTGSSGQQAIPKTREEAAQMSGGGPKELVAFDHPKNGQEVEVSSGSSTLDFDF